MPFAKKFLFLANTIAKHTAYLCIIYGLRCVFNTYFACHFSFFTYLKPLKNRKNKAKTPK